MVCLGEWMCLIHRIEFVLDRVGWITERQAVEVLFNQGCEIASRKVYFQGGAV